MNLLKCVLVGVFLWLAIGCTGGDHPVKVEPTQVAPAAALKAGLQDIAKSGELGSGAETIQEEIEKLRATDAAKADELSADFQTLSSMTDPAKIKAEAQKMADKL